MGLGEKVKRGVLNTAKARLRRALSKHESNSLQVAGLNPLLLYVAQFSVAT